MGAAVGKSDGAMSDINMTPLIDIVLVVLIIMMVNVPIQIEEMGVKVPGPTPLNPPPPDPNAEQLVIAVYADGSVALNRTAMPEDKMIYEAGRRLRSMSKKQVFVDAAPDVPYGRVIDMVDLAREAGAVKVGLAKLKPDGPRAVNNTIAGGMAKGLHPVSPLIVGASTITEKKADAALQRILPKLESCYLQRLAMRPGLKGSVSFRVEIGPQGEHLSDPVIRKDSSNDLDFRTCIEPIFKELRYEPLGEQLTAAIQYTLILSPG